MLIRTSQTFLQYLNRNAEEIQTSDVEITEGFRRVHAGAEQPLAPSATFDSGLSRSFDRRRASLEQFDVDSAGPVSPKAGTVEAIRLHCLATGRSDYAAVRKRLARSQRRDNF